VTITEQLEPFVRSFIDSSFTSKVKYEAWVRSQTKCMGMICNVLYISVSQGSSATPRTARGRRSGERRRIAAAQQAPSTVSP
jgi:hypothetical protein